MTNEPFTFADIKEILLKWENETLSASMVTDILNEKAIAFSDAAREDEAVAVLKWASGNGWKSADQNTAELIYSIYLQHKNEKK